MESRLLSGRRRRLPNLLTCTSSPTPQQAAQETPSMSQASGSWPICLGGLTLYGRYLGRKADGVNAAAKPATRNVVGTQTLVRGPCNSSVSRVQQGREAGAYLQMNTTPPCHHSPTNVCLLVGSPLGPHSASRRRREKITSSRSSARAVSARPRELTASCSLPRPAAPGLMTDIPKELGKDGDEEI